MTVEEKNHTVRITNIQRFCLHDGPGIRTTVFLKGCSVQCPWCANPENIRYELQQWKDENGLEGIYGKDISLGNLAKELYKDECFFLEDGGITFSGGEPLLQISKYEPLLYDLKEKGIHLTVETALFVEPKFVEIALHYFDFWYVDMKTLVPEECFRLISGDICQYMKNLLTLVKEEKDICIRIPCVPNIADNRENMMLMCNILKKLKIRNTELFQIHNMGNKKYRSLDLKEPIYDSSTNRSLCRVAKCFNQNGIRFRIVSV